MSKEYYVYQYIVQETGEIFYIGKGSTDRAFKGKRNKFCEDMKNTHNYKIEIIYDNLSEQEAFEKEIETIKYVKENFPNYRLTNQTFGGEGSSGYKHTEKSKKIMSEASKNLWKNQDFVDNQMYHRKNGVYQSEEFRKKISELVSGEKNPNYQHYWTDDMKKALSEKRIKNGKSKGHKNARAIKVVSEELKLIFMCKKYASIYYGVSQSTINVMLKLGKLVLFNEELHNDYKEIYY